MKGVLRVHKIDNVNKLKRDITSIEGVIALYISKESEEVTVIFDEYFTTLEDIIDKLENDGHIIL
ncbi:Hypothetical protein CM240_0157 [Clostridium bornimense]|uniref:HMA domain-containing protein n=1 Tax=Clostridium bornimense TaxID=1216932 RepID=W6RRW9_9CLOT|nr:hypothetical protein [Clostridium bornimense]CDM67331.1 Hypothetical protein CM240_0157 [Clostridium bornimense]